MPQSDADRVRDIYGAWNQVTSDEWVERYFTPDCEWHDAPELPDSGVHHGAEAIRQMLRALVGVAGHFDLQVLEGHDAGDQAVVVFRMVGHGDHSGLPVELLASHAVTLRDGRVKRVLAFIDRPSGFRAAGIEP